MFKRILVPLDGSPLAEAVLSYATMLAEHTGAEILLLRVVEYPADLYTTCCEYLLADPELSLKLAEKKNAIEEEALHYLERKAEKLRKQGWAVSVKVGVGPVVDAIIECTEDPGVDLIVMSTHARSGPDHRVIGAVADRVLFEAAVPVLLVHANRPVRHSSHFTMTGMVYPA